MADLKAISEMKEIHMDSFISMIFKKLEQMQEEFSSLALDCRIDAQTRNRMMRLIDEIETVIETSKKEFRRLECKTASR